MCLREAGRHHVRKPTSFETDGSHGTTSAELAERATERRGQHPARARSRQRPPKPRTSPSTAARSQKQQQAAASSVIDPPLPAMEVGDAVLAAISVPCLVLLLVLGEAGLRVAALALRGEHGRPTRSAFLGYRVSRPAVSSSSHYSVFHDDDVDDEPPPLPAECCDRLAVAVYRRGDAVVEPECAFCLCAVRDGVDETRDLRCRHVFHRACLDAWLVRPRATCPLCRDRLLPALDDDGGYFVEVADDEDDLLSSTSSSPASAYDAHGGALWHTTRPA